MLQSNNMVLITKQMVIFFGVWSVRSLVTSVFGHFGPFLRTEVTKDRTGSVTSVLRTEQHIKRTDLHMHFGKQTSMSGCMCIDGVIMTLDSDNQ